MEESLAISQAFEISPGKYTISFDGSGSLVYFFNANGTGRVNVGGGVNDIVWAVNPSGSLVVTTSDFTDTYTLTSGSSVSGTLSVHTEDMTEGESEATGSIVKN